ncbi:hypothetical protein pb186bvf_017949 [Paramecium bursaria]
MYSILKFNWSDKNYCMKYKQFCNQISFIHQQKFTFLQHKQGHDENNQIFFLYHKRDDGNNLTMDDTFDEVWLCKDIKRRIQKLYEEFLESDEYKWAQFSVDQKIKIIFKKVVEILVQLIVLVSCSLLIYYQIDQWVNLEDDEKWIYDTQIPWRLVYILISIPIIIIWGADYNIESQNEKELLLLDIPDLKLDFDIENTILII